MGLAWLATVLVGCATSAPTAESKDRAECKQYARGFADHRCRMKDACLISRGHRQIYSTVLGDLWVRSTAEPRQPAEAVGGRSQGLQRRDESVEQRGVGAVLKLHDAARLRRLGLLRREPEEAFCGVPPSLRGVQ